MRLDSGSQVAAMVAATACSGGDGGSGLDRGLEGLPAAPRRGRQEISAPGRSGRPALVLRCLRGFDLALC